MLKCFPELTIRDVTQNRVGHRKLDDLIFHALRGKNTAAVAVVGVNKCQGQKVYVHDLVHTPRVKLLYGSREYTAFTVLWAGIEGDSTDSKRATDCGTNCFLIISKQSM